MRKTVNEIFFIISIEYTGLVDLLLVENSTIILVLKRIALKKLNSLSINQSFGPEQKIFFFELDLLLE